MSPVEKTYREEMERLAAGLERAEAEQRHEVNTQNHQRVNAEAMKRAYSVEDVEVPNGRIAQLMELVAEGWVAPTTLARMYEKDVPPLEEPLGSPSTMEHLESLRARVIEEAGISASLKEPPEPTHSVYCGCFNCNRQRRELIPSWWRDQRPPPMERRGNVAREVFKAPTEAPRPTPKCPPTCTPAAPCAQPSCKAVLHRMAEVDIGTNMRLLEKACTVPPWVKPPRPEARRIAAADLSFGRWNGRVPR